MGGTAVDDIVPYTDKVVYGTFYSIHNGFGSTIIIQKCVKKWFCVMIRVR